MWHDLANAVGLMLVIEGLGPFINPAAMRRAFLLASQIQEQNLRWLGLISMACGVVVMYLL
jgi:hypothetical protein